MIAHYLKIALRNVLKDRIYSSINVIGLSLITAGLIAVQVYLTTRQNPAEVVKAE